MALTPKMDMIMTTNEKKKELKITMVSFKEFSDIDFLAPSTFFYKNAMGDFIFIHTASRQIAQEYVDELTGVKGKYSVITSKLQKAVSKLEGGGYSVTGTETRKR
jgi:hypothetical protein